MTTALTTRNPTALAAQKGQFTREQVDLIKRTIAPEATDDELQLFVVACKQSGLDPFTRQIYCTFVWDKKLNRKKMQIQATIDGFRVVASRSKHYAGQAGPFWCGKNGEWKDVWLSEEYPVAAKVGVYHSNFKEPLYAVALWDEYKQTLKSGAVGHMWHKMPALMLAKCAEALALRKAFPNDLSGLYTREEMMQAGAEDAPTDTPAIEGEVIDEDDFSPAPGDPGIPLPTPITSHQRTEMFALAGKLRPDLKGDALKEHMKQYIKTKWNIDADFSLSENDPQAISVELADDVITDLHIKIDFDGAPEDDTPPRTDDPPHIGMGEAQQGDGESNSRPTPPPSAPDPEREKLILWLDDAIQTSGGNQFLVDHVIKQHGLLDMYEAPVAVLQEIKDDIIAKSGKPKQENLI